MDKPEDISGPAWAVAYKISEADCGCAPGRRRANGTSHSDSCWKHTEAIARAILSAQSQAYIDAARIAEDWEPVEKLLPFADDSHNEAAHTGQYEAGERISAAILQRKEEIGR